ncbi:hypothetical protein HARCEL1_04595 [Halococcoides cellulosivorans]|uniref:Uncharacterized protein n=1 Tax=Halococcoides cellulosivorans TaxID=1679096 RepID=A0A2R4WZQ5_9EURY|nr:hypothetical protein HARCEL1_04595 [Halococcoides cellulosivorans]
MIEDESVVGRVCGTFTVRNESTADVDLSVPVTVGNKVFEPPGPPRRGSLPETAARQFNATGG